MSKKLIKLKDKNSNICYVNTDNINYIVQYNNQSPSIVFDNNLILYIDEKYLSKLIEDVESSASMI